MRQLKLAGIGVLVAATVLALGFLWGARGRWAAEERLSLVEQQLLLSDARRATYAGSLELQKLNFGAAAGHFEAARAASDQARLRFEAAGETTRAEQAGTAAGLLNEARSLCARLDQAAGERAQRAARSLEQAAQPSPRDAKSAR
jgi:hypothetical protein